MRSSWYFVQRKSQSHEIMMMMRSGEGGNQKFGSCQNENEMKPHFNLSFHFHFDFRANPDIISQVWIIVIKFNLRSPRSYFEFRRTPSDASIVSCTLSREPYWVILKMMMISFHTSWEKWEWERCSWRVSEKGQKTSSARWMNVYFVMKSQNSTSAHQDISPLLFRMDFCWWI